MPGDVPTKVALRTPWGSGHSEDQVLGLECGRCGLTPAVWAAQVARLATAPSGPEAGHPHGEPGSASSMGVAVKVTCLQGRPMPRPRCARTFQEER